MDAQQLALSTGARIDRAREHLPHVLAAMQEFDISTPVRQAAFLAQVGHESGGLHWLIELWGPTEAQRRYEVRQDLGNNQPGDGFRFRGRGLIQLTGRANYEKASKALGVDLVAAPELLGQCPLADRSAAWFWKAHSCNEMADHGQFERITRTINGGLNGYPERLALWAKAKAAFALA